MTHAEKQFRRRCQPFGVGVDLLYRAMRIVAHAQFDGVLLLAKRQGVIIMPDGSCGNQA